jgi:hypothetical protein
VARVSRSDAIVSLQFRPPTAQWIFTATVRGDNKTPDDFAGYWRAANVRSATARLHFCVPNREFPESHANRQPMKVGVFFG